MIATEASLYGPLHGHAGASGSGVTTPLSCGCGQDLGTTERPNCPRCGCSLN